MVGVDADCSGCFELGVLAFGVLVGSADAGVADDLAGNARGVFGWVYLKRLPLAPIRYPLPSTNVRMRNGAPCTSGTNAYENELGHKSVTSVYADDVYADE